MKNYIVGKKREKYCRFRSRKLENALEQEKRCKSALQLDYKTDEKITPPGWLVWSNTRYGCGVVYRRSDGKMIILTGMQGDFCCC